MPSPFYGNVDVVGAYEQAKARNQAGTMGQIQQVGALAQLDAQMRKAQMEQQYRQAISTAKPEDMPQIAAKFAGPGDVLHWMTAERTAKNALAERAMQHLENLSLKEKELERKSAEGLDRAASQAELAAIRRQQLTLTETLGRMGLSIRQQAVDQAATRASEQQQQKHERDVQQFGTALERAGLPEIDSVLKNVEQSLANSPKLPEYLPGPKSIVPDMFVPEDIRAGRQAFQKLFNVTLKDRSGAAVTNQELERLKKEFATGLWKTPEQIANGVTQMRQIISDHYRGIGAGFTPQVVNTYTENLRTSGGTPLLENQGKGIPKISSDAEYNALQSGAVFIDPNGKQRKKP